MFKKGLYNTNKISYNTDMININTKICRGNKTTGNKCSVTPLPQPLDKFCKNKKAKDGKSNFCKVCGNLFNNIRNKTSNPARDLSKYEDTIKAYQTRPDNMIIFRARNEIKKELNVKKSRKYYSNILGCTLEQFHKHTSKVNKDDELDHNVPVILMKRVFRNNEQKLEKAMDIVSSYTNLKYIPKMDNRVKSAKLLPEYKSLFKLMVKAVNSNMSKMNFIKQSLNLIGGK